MAISPDKNVIYGRIAYQTSNIFNNMRNPLSVYYQDMIIAMMGNSESYVMPICPANKYTVSSSNIIYNITNSSITKVNGAIKFVN